MTNWKQTTKRHKQAIAQERKLRLQLEQQARQQTACQGILKQITTNVEDIVILKPPPVIPVRPGRVE